MSSKDSLSVANHKAAARETLPQMVFDRVMALCGARGPGEPTRDLIA